MALNNELCLISAQSSEFMVSNFDNFPRHTRDLLNASLFNICPACFSNCGGGEDSLEYDRWLLTWFEQAIMGLREPPCPREVQAIWAWQRRQQDYGGPMGIDRLREEEYRRREAEARRRYAINPSAKKGLDFL
jgi:hypothetical protein